MLCFRFAPLSTTQFDYFSFFHVAKICAIKESKKHVTHVSISLQRNAINLKNFTAKVWDFWLRKWKQPQQQSQPLTLTMWARKHLRISSAFCSFYDFYGNFITVSTWNPSIFLIFTFFFNGSSIKLRYGVISAWVFLSSFLVILFCFTRTHISIYLLGDWEKVFLFFSSPYTCAGSLNLFDFSLTSFYFIYLSVFLREICNFANDSICDSKLFKRHESNNSTKYAKKLARWKCEIRFCIIYFHPQERSVFVRHILISHNRKMCSLFVVWYPWKKT